MVLINRPRKGRTDWPQGRLDVPLSLSLPFHIFEVGEEQLLHRRGLGPLPYFAPGSGLGAPPELGEGSSSMEDGWEGSLVPWPMETLQPRPSCPRRAQAPVTPGTAVQPGVP